MNKGDGRRFFNDTQKALKIALSEFELASIYDIASGAGQHVRMAGMARSIVSRDGMPSRIFTRRKVECS